MQKIHFHNDFDVHLNFTNIKTDYVSRVEFWTRRDDVFCCCKCDGSLKVEDDTNIVCYLNDHNLGTGKLNYNVIFQIPDFNYADGYKKVCQHYVSDIFLTSENGDTTVAIVKVLGDEKVTDLINRLSEFEKVFDNKQDKLKFDTTPTIGSKNVVYSDGIYSAIKNNKPDLSDYAKKTDLQGLATENWVNDKGYITTILEDYAKKSDIPSVEGLATEQWVNNQGYITSIPDDYVTKTYLQNGHYATMGWVNRQGFVTENWFKLRHFATEDWVNSKGYITTIPDDYVTETELDSKGYLTEHQSLDDYVKKSDLPSNTSVEVVTVTPAADTEYTLNSNQYLRIIPADAVKLTFNKSDGTGLMREYHILIDCKTAVPKTEFKGVLWDLDNDPSFEKGKFYDIVIRDDGDNLYGSWKSYKLITILITTSDATAVQLNNTTYNLVAGDNSLTDIKLKIITDINGFNGNDKITSIDFDDARIKIEDLNNIFSGMSNLTKISNITIKDAVSQYNMFGYDTSLKEIDTSNWDVSKLTQFTSMFNNCSSLTSLDVSKWDVSSGTYFSFMFELCTGLKSLDVSKWNVSSATDFTHMFYGCESLTSLDVSKWDVSSAYMFAQMFSFCTGLTSLDISDWDVSSATAFVSMFDGCRGLTSLDVSKWDVSKVTDFAQMFAYCSGLTSLDISKWNVSSAITFSEMFAECTGLTTLDVSNWNVSSATNLSRMFYNCSGLTSLDVSDWDVSSATDLSYMFSNCSGLTTLDVSNWDVSKVTNFSFMFGGCSGLTTLGILKWNTSKPTDLSWMFYNCSGLEFITVVFDTSSVTNFSSMFHSCRSLRAHGLRGWNTSKATDFSYMYYGCSDLTSIDAYGLDTSSVTDFSNMFAFCSSLKEITISRWTISAEANITDMFQGCNSLTTIKMYGCSQETIDKINSVKPASATIES